MNFLAFLMRPESDQSFVQNFNDSEEIEQRHQEEEEDKNEIQFEVLMSAREE